MIPRPSGPRRETEPGGEERERKDGRRAQKAELGGHPLKGPNRENRSDQGGPEATRDPPSRPWSLVAVTRGEALTNRAARAVVGTQSQHSDSGPDPLLIKHKIPTGKTQH
ncbi:hypothetical protein NDU88_001698 [Pleurodeles waltl]|uniref:Uncharacterized protein n=1 Tax=Pleurodeles waltl TaxID=8319 RepID=A0AAV7T193_PLEWA|nr:hypothetical protein NDU88_001698 [Pleurodeles waltl]